MKKLYSCATGIPEPFNSSDGSANNKPKMPFGIRYKSNKHKVEIKHIIKTFKDVKFASGIKNINFGFCPYIH